MLKYYLFTAICSLSLFIFFSFVPKISYAETVRTPCDGGTPGSYCWNDPNVGNTGTPQCPNGSTEVFLDYCIQTCTKFGCSQYICCTSTGGPTCNSVTGGFCNNPGHSCPAGYTFASSSFECTDACCRPIVCSDIGGTCALPGHFCPNGRTSDYNNDQSCYSGGGLCCQPIQNCNAGGLACNACYQTSGPGTNQCGTATRAHDCSYTTYAGSTTCYQNYNIQQSCSNIFVDNCNTGAGYTCTNGNICLTNISVNVHTDYNHSGTGGTNRSGVPINDGGGNTFNTNASGNVTFTQKAMGGYTITMTTPANYQVTASTAVTQTGVSNNTHASPSNITSFSLGTTNGNEQVNYYVTPLYNISGRVFKDTNKNQKYDPGTDSGYGGGTIHITGPTAVADRTAAGDGTWTTPTNLLSGTYTVSYTSALSTGFQFTTPSSFSVTLGDPAGSPVCNKGASLDTACGGINNGSISGLDFGLTDENAWSQSVCFDVRDDSGSYTDPIPAAPSCGGVGGAYNSIINGSCSTGAGIIFTCDATPDFGLGSANANNWRAGGAATDKECFTGAGLDVIRTSYDYLKTTMQQSGITPIDMNQITVCGAGGLANCVLSPTLAKGVYLADGDLTLSPGSGTYTFPVDVNTPQGFVFLVHGNLTIQRNIIVPAGSVAAFSASGNITVDKTVGNIITNTNDPVNNNPNLEGLYSADANFIIQSYAVGTSICNADGTPIDKKLNIVGSVITNAAKAGGALINNRDLCIYDLACSSVSLGDNNGLALSYLLTLIADGKFLNHKVFNWQELRP